MKRTTEIENKYLLDFIRSCRHHENIIDGLMAKKESFERGKEIAKEMNRFNLDLDLFLHFGLKIDMDKLYTVLNKSFRLKQQP